MSLSGARPTVSVFLSPKSSRSTVARYDVGSVRSQACVSARSFSMSLTAAAAAVFVSTTGRAGDTAASATTAVSDTIVAHALRFKITSGSDRSYHLASVVSATIEDASDG